MVIKQVQISYICIILKAINIHTAPVTLLRRASRDARGFLYVFLVFLVLADPPQATASGANPGKDIFTREEQGNELFLSRRFEEAAALFREAYYDTEGLDNALVPAGFAFKAGTAYHQAGDFEKALSYLQRAEVVLEQVPGPDFNAQIMLYTNIGAVKIKMARFSRAVAYYQKAEALVLASRGRNHPFMGSIYLNMGVIFHYGGDHENCRRYYDRSLQLFRENEAAHRSSISRVLHNLGLLAYDRADYEQALAYFRESQEFIVPNDASTRASTYNNMARCMNRMGAYEEAEEHYLRAIELTREAFGNSHPELGSFALNYASFLARLDRHEDALQVITEITPVFEERYDSLHPLQARYRETMADLWLRSGNVDKAMHYAEKAADILFHYQKELGGLAERSGYNPAIRNFLLTNLKQQASIRNQMAEQAVTAEDRLENKKRRLLALTEAISVVADLRVDYAGEYSKMTLAGEEKGTFVAAADAAVELYQLTGDRGFLHQAYEISGQAKGAVLTQVIKGFEGFRVADVPASYQQEEAELQRKLHMLEMLISEESERIHPNRERIAYWKDQLFETSLRYQELTEILEREYPEYYRLKYEAGVMDVQAIQDNLQEGQVLVEYLMNDHTLFVFAFSETTYQVYRQELDASFFVDQRHLHDAFNLDHALFGGRSGYLSFTASAHSLYQLLLEPVMRDFDPESLIIVPDEKLSLLPFEVLLTAPARTDMPDYAGLDYLVRKLPVSYAYSSALMFDTQQNSDHRGRAAPLEALVMAPSYGEPGSAPGLAMQEYGFTGRDLLMPLPGALKEAAFVREHFGGRMLSGEEATKQAFFDHVEEADILHLAMHAIVDTINPMHSRLVFRTAEQGASVDNLFAYEIYGMQIPARLAVLSACNTGAGKVVSGEGVMSFTRSFLYAGVRNILMTLWGVPDQASTTLIRHFYAELSEQVPKHQALQRAKLDFITQSLPSKAHPYYWAGYVTIGDVSPLEPRPEEPEQPATRHLVWVVNALVLMLLGYRGLRMLA